MILNKLESGLLLFDTPQGYVAVEPSFRERVYLLWTFRNFRQLSLPLLNARQIALVRDLARKNAGAKLERYDALRVIGVVENFALPTKKMSALPMAMNVGAISSTAAVPTISSAMSVPPQQAESRLPEEGEIAGVGIAAKVSQSMQAYWDLAKATLTKVKPPEFKVPKFNLAKFSLPKFHRATVNPAIIAVDPEIVSEAESEPALVKPRIFELAPSRLATAAGVIALCLGTVAAWHRIGGVLGSEAYGQPQVSVANTEKTKLMPAEPTVAEAAGAPETANNGIGVDAQSKQEAGEHQELASIAPVAPTDGRAAHDQVAPLTTRKNAHRGIVSTSKFPLATIESGIQATRPPLRFVYPRYADLSARGVVALMADVDASGAVRSVRVVKGNRSLAAAAISAVRKWRYRPYMKDGHAVATETNIVISFFSNDAITMSFPPSVAVAR